MTDGICSHRKAETNWEHQGPGLGVGVVLLFSLVFWRALFVCLNVTIKREKERGKKEMESRGEKGGEGGEERPKREEKTGHKMFGGC